ncbi:hypothetical protein BDN72DRAFT_843792 [Pluteus cervinus]|uniref:Uncharacterized protein n=1 Tax=Pluteus cervinus TaxID=181527 RepID=A0ACD3ANG0_9AGAR|nr:hypothetical protein BDN72DRAFT_843792 [Pluteus cervinus]
MGSRYDKASSSWSERIAEEIDQRRRTRSARRTEHKRAAKELEVQGNRFLEAGNYNKAIERFEAALKSFGSRDPLWLNITKAHIRLKNWSDAEVAATCALKYNPRRTEARYLRGVARKELGRYTAAIGDLEAVEYESAEFFDARKALEDAKRECPPSQYPATANDLWPSIKHEAIDETEPDSDTSDCLHIGDYEPCQRYNHKTCPFGTRCYHSHAPDERSWRDERGKNVCIHFLMGYCRFSDGRCKYTHVEDYLPTSGWWSRPDRVDYVWARFQVADRHDRSKPKTLIRQILHGPLPTWFWKDDDAESDSDRSESKSSWAPDLAPVTPPPTQHFILVLVLERVDDFLEDYSHLVSALKSEVKVIIASDSAAALSHIESPSCVGIFVGDVGITRHDNRALLAKFVSYVKKGGTGVVGATFGTFVSDKDAQAFFNDALGLTWKLGSYFRTTFFLNAPNDIVQLNPSLPTSYSMKALHLSGLKPGEAVYHQPDEDEAPVVSTTVGEGRLAYIGDVNGEVGATKTVLALLGLLDSPHPPLTPTPIATEPAQVDLHSFAKPKGASKPFIMILSQGWEESFEAHCSELFSLLKEKVEVLHGLSIDRVLDLLPSPGLTGIFVTSPHILEKENSPLVPALGAYIKSGGILVFGGLFSARVRYDKFTDFIRNLSGFSWSIAANTSSSLAPNGKHALSTKSATLPQNLHTKAIFISGITPDMALYLPVKGEQYYEPLDQASMAPIVYAKCGGGWLGIVGDVNWGKENAQIVLAMLGLKEH